MWASRKCVEFKETHHRQCLSGLLNRAQIACRYFKRAYSYGIFMVESVLGTILISFFNFILRNLGLRGIKHLPRSCHFKWHRWNLGGGIRTRVQVATLQQHPFHGAAQAQSLSSLIIWGAALSHTEIGLGQDYPDGASSCRVWAK